MRNGICPNYDKSVKLHSCLILSYNWGSEERKPMMTDGSLRSRLKTAMMLARKEVLFAQLRR